MIRLIESAADTWLPILWRASLQGGLAILIAFVAVIVAKRLFRFPAWGEHWVWRLVYLKLLVALLIAQPILLPILPPPAITRAVVPTADAIRDVQLRSFSMADAPPVAAEGSLTTSSTTQVHVTTTAPITTGRNLGLKWLALLFVAWSIGAGLSLLTLVRQFLTSLRLPLQPITATWLNSECQRLSHAYKLKDVPRLAVSDHIHGPLLVGLIRPTIVFSPDVLARCTREQLQAVLAHEMSHIRRFDLRWNLLPAVVRVVFFFHPLLWLANHRWHVSSELASDAMAVQRCRGSVAQYADGLLQVAALGVQRFRLATSLGCVAAFTSTRSLKLRLLAMKNETVCSPSRAVLYAGCIAVIGFFGVLPWKAVSRAADPSSDAIGENMGFEEKSDQGFASSWGGGGEGYSLKLDETQPHGGKSSALISGESKDGFGTYTQCLDASGLRGKRIAYRGFLKSDTKGTGALWMRIDADETLAGFDNMPRRRIRGKTDWAQHEIVLDVPQQATRICFGFLMTGSGKLWSDDLSVKVLGPAGEGLATTDNARQREKLQTELLNGGFEDLVDADLPMHWGGGGKGHRLSRDEQVKRSGKASGRIEKKSDEGQFASFTQMFPAKAFLGKRIRLSGWLKTKDAKSAGLWLRIDGPEDKLLGFDNMQTRPVKGTTEWTGYSIVLDVPKEATDIAVGIMSLGEGTVWGDDLELESIGPAGEGPSTTGVDVGKVRQRPTTLVNTGFDEPSEATATLPAGWGGGGKGYKLTRDETSKNSGTASGRIEKVGEGNFGTFTQMFPANDFRGKKLRYSGMLKTKDAQSCGLWMRIDGPDDKPLGFDNMGRRRVQGTTDWSEYSIELDVPDTATHIALGFLSSGDGTVWGDDLKLEVVTAD